MLEKYNFSDTYICLLIFIHGMIYARHFPHCLQPNFDDASGVDRGFLERGFICIRGWGFALMISSHFS